MFRELSQMHCTYLGSSASYGRVGVQLFANSAFKMSPFQALYGCPPPSFPIQLLNNIAVEAENQFLQDRQQQS